MKFVCVWFFIVSVTALTHTHTEYWNALNSFPMQQFNWPSGLNVSLLSFSLSRVFLLILTYFSGCFDYFLPLLCCYPFGCRSLSAPLSRDDIFPFTPIMVFQAADSNQWLIISNSKSLLATNSLKSVALRFTLYAPPQTQFTVSPRFILICVNLLPNDSAHVVTRP